MSCGWSCNSHSTRSKPASRVHPRPCPTCVFTSLRRASCRSNRDGAATVNLCPRLLWRIGAEDRKSPYSSRNELQQPGSDSKKRQRTDVNRPRVYVTGTRKWHLRCLFRQRNISICRAKTDGPGRTRTCDLGIKSPVERAEACSVRLHEAATYAVCGCCELQQVATAGDRPVRASVRALLVWLDNIKRVVLPPARLPYFLELFHISTPIALPFVWPTRLLELASSRQRVGALGLREASASPRDG